MMKYPLLINEFEYEFLTRNWNGPVGAAYNSVYEWLGENGLIARKLDGWHTTSKGKQAVKDFEEFYHKLA